jgi:signal transduction histidine kinase
VENVEKEFDKQLVLPFHRRIAFQFGTPLVLFIALVLAVLLLSTAVSFMRIWDDFERRPVRLAGSAALEVTRFLKSQELLFEMLSAGVGNPEVFDAQDRILFSKIVSKNTAILELVFYDVQGIETMAITKATAGQITDSEFRDGRKFIELISGAGNPILLPLRWSQYQTPYVVWVFPIENTDNSIIGAMQATVDVSILWSIVSTYREMDNIHLRIVDTNGIVLVGKSSTILKTEPSFLNDSRFVRFSAGEFGAHIDREDNTDFVGAWSRVKPTGWGLLAEVPVSLYYTSLRSEAILFILAFIVLLMLIGIQLVLMKRALLSPLKQMILSIALFSENNYSTRIKLNVHNELSILADTFNRMACNIEERTSKIVERLRSVAVEQDMGAKLLIRRDLELARANDRLQALDASKSQFVSVAAHQLRTPLSAIRWALQMLIDGDIGKMNEEQKKMLIRTAESNHRMIQLVNDLLDVDHIEAGKMSYVFIQLDIVDVVKSVLQELAPLATEKGVLFEFCDLGEKHTIVRADPGKIRLVVENIVENAVKYTPAEGKVTICVYDADDSVELRVTDTGIGIPQVHREQIFKKFFRAKNAVQMETSGSGLGLFVAKEILDRHQGRIWFESLEGKGTVFHFTIPRATDVPSRAPL